MTENSDKLDNMTVRRFAKLIKGNSTNNGSTGITTGTVIQNDNQLYVAVDDETLVPVSDTASNVNVGDKVTLAIDNEEALIVGNNSDASPTASELSETDTKATFAKVDASEAKDTAQTAQVTANTAQNTAETAQTTADNAQSTATEAKETADAVDGKATEAKETATQAQATATTASETATQAQTTANTAKETADTASTKADTAQTTAETAQAKAEGAEKVATNFIDIDDNKGITVGDITAGTLGKNTYIDSNGVSIRDGETVLASFEDDEIQLGQQSDTATIHFGNGFCQIMKDSKGVNIIGQKNLTLHTFDSSGTSDLTIGCGKMDVTGYYYNGSKQSTQSANIQIENSKVTIGNECSNPEVEIVGKDSDGKLSCANIFQNGTKVSVEGHTHTTSDLTDAGTLAKTGHKHTVSDITDYEPFDPSDYAKASHTHTQSDITDFAHTHTKSDITDFSHTHTKSEISDFDHNHAGDALTPATINTTSTIKQNGTQVSLEGHTHVMDDITDFTQKMFMTKSFNVSYTLPANTLKDVTISNKVNGYTAIGVFDYSTSSGGVFPARISVGRAGTATFGLKNTTSSQISKTLGVNFLYVKSDFFDKYN